MSHVGIFLSSLSGGGVERSTLILAGALAARGHRVDLVVCRPDGELWSEVPDTVRLVPLRPVSGTRGRLEVLLADPAGVGRLLLPVLLPYKASSKIRFLPALADYLRNERPDILMSGMTHPNLVALWARRRARVPCRVVVVEHNTLSRFIAHFRRRWRRRFQLPMVARAYAEADAVVAVSRGVADDLIRSARLPASAIATVYNPVDLARIESLAAEAPSHPWLAASGAPVILAVGKLSAQKDHATLLRAFARIRQGREARLVVLGEGPERAALEKLADELGVAADVDLAGFAANPFACMARARVFVLSSAWEGLGNVLIEALACGAPVVSTRCESGPAEILSGGVHGPLVPVGDDEVLAAAIVRVLDAPPEPESLRKRARDFSLENAMEGYVRVLGLDA